MMTVVPGARPACIDEMARKLEAFAQTTAVAAQKLREQQDGRKQRQEEKKEKP